MAPKKSSKKIVEQKEEESTFTWQCSFQPQAAIVLRDLFAILSQPYVHMTVSTDHEFFIQSMDAKQISMIEFTLFPSAFISRSSIDKPLLFCVCLPQIQNLLGHCLDIPFHQMTWKLDREKLHIVIQRCNGQVLTFTVPLMKVAFELLETKKQDYETEIRLSRETVGIICKQLLSISDEIQLTIYKNMCAFHIENAEDGISGEMFLRASDGPSKKLTKEEIKIEPQTYSLRLLTEMTRLNSGHDPFIQLCIGTNKPLYIHQVLGDSVNKLGTCDFYLAPILKDS
jgi:hypothetical protein